MLSRNRGIRRVLAVCLLIAAEFGSIFAFTLLMGAITGRGFAGSILLGGFGLLLLLVFVSVFVVALMWWRSLNSI